MPLSDEQKANIEKNRAEALERRAKRAKTWSEGKLLLPATSHSHEMNADTVDPGLALGPEHSSTANPPPTAAESASSQPTNPQVPIDVESHEPDGDLVADTEETQEPDGALVADIDENSLTRITHLQSTAAAAHWRQQGPTNLAEALQWDLCKLLMEGSWIGIGDILHFILKWVLSNKIANCDYPAHHTAPHPITPHKYVIHIQENNIYIYVYIYINIYIYTSSLSLYVCVYIYIYISIPGFNRQHMLVTIIHVAVVCGKS